MNKETYERLRLVIDEFDAEDVIVTSGEEQNVRPDFVAGANEGTTTGTGMDMPYGTF